VKLNEELGHTESKVKSQVDLLKDSIFDTDVTKGMKEQLREMQVSLEEVEYRD